MPGESFCGWGRGDGGGEAFLPSVPFARGALFLRVYLCFPFLKLLFESGFFGALLADLVDWAPFLLMADVPLLFRLGIGCFSFDAAFFGCSNSRFPSRRTS